MSNVYGVYLLTYDEDYRTWYEVIQPQLVMDEAYLGKGEQLLFTLKFHVLGEQWFKNRDVGELMIKTPKKPIRYKLVVTNDEGLGNKHVKLEKEFEVASGYQSSK